MFKFHVITLDIEHRRLFSFEVPESQTAIEGIEQWRNARHMKLNGRRCLTYYNARHYILPALREEGNKDVIKRLAVYDKDPLAIGVVFDELIAQPKPPSKD